MRLPFALAITMATLAFYLLDKFITLRRSSRRVRMHNMRDMRDG